MAGGPMMGAPPAPKKNNTTLWIVVVIIVVVLAVVIAGTLLALSVFNNVTNQDISMTVLGTSNPSSSDYSIAPSSGMTYIQVTVSMTNNGDIPTAVSGIWFQIQASGTKYSATTHVTSDTTSTSLLVGSTATFKVSFEIPITASPQKIIYNPILGHQVSANI
jgi:hypothetical protein